MRCFGFCLALGLLSAVHAHAQNPDSGASASRAATESPAEPATPTAPKEDKRIFGVLPNNRTTEPFLPFSPISAGRKMTIAAKDSFDWPVYPTAAAFACCTNWRTRTRHSAKA